jgi:hypothetical protein
MADIVPIKAHREYARSTKRSAAGCLRDARAKHPVEVLVIRTDAAGQFFVIGAPPDPDGALWMMEKAKLKLLGII